MSTRNYNITDQTEAVRTVRVSFDYPAENSTITSTYDEANVIFDKNGNEKLLSRTGDRHSFLIPVTDLAQSIDLVDIKTGIKNGAQMTIYQILVGVTSLVRQDQLRRDAADEPETEV
jgi:hypothetical protein